MKFLKENWFKVVIAVAVLIIILSVREFLSDYNEIQAEKARAECLHKAHEIGFPYDAPCTDIKDYHIKVRDLKF